MGSWIEKMLKSNIVQEGDREVSMDEDNIFKGQHFQGNLIQYQNGTLILHIMRYEGPTLYPLDNGAAQHVVRKIEEFFREYKFSTRDLFIQLPPDKWTSVEVVMTSKKVFGYRTRHIMKELMKVL